MQFFKPVHAGPRLKSYQLCLCLFALTSCIGFARAGERPLTLADALSRTMAEHPDLRVFDLRLKGLEGSRITAGLAPAYEAGLEVENVFGSGEQQGIDRAEYTLSLSSAIELGGKRRARTGVASSRYELLEAQREAETLDLLGQVTRHYIAALALQEKIDLAGQAAELNDATLKVVKRRARQGAVPEAEVLRARAGLAQSRIAYDALQTDYKKRKIALASMWGETQLDFHRLQGDLFQFGPSEQFDVLYQQVSESPAIKVYASELRLHEAQIQLAESQSETDIHWQIGARRFEETGDTALVAGISMPLFAGRRNRGEIQVARTAREEVAYRGESALLQLHSLLFAAYHTRQQNIEAVEQLRTTVLPDLTEALEMTRHAYERGRYSYEEWIAAQRELLSAREALIDAATRALLNQALIEQLTAAPMTRRQPAIRTVD